MRLQRREGRYFSISTLDQNIVISVGARLPQVEREQNGSGPGRKESDWWKRLKGTFKTD